MNHRVFLRVLFLLFPILLFFPPIVSSDLFSPTPLNIISEDVIPYLYDGSDLEILVNVSGTPAKCIFLVFTHDLDASIRNVQNGYLGWHYVNKIDTCIYTSQPMQFDIGVNTITWDGKDQDGGLVSPGEYTYYIWGIDNVNFKIPLTKHISPHPWGRITLTIHDEQGNPLGNPIIWQASGQNIHWTTQPIKLNNKKWIVGNDPYDSDLLETCSNLGLNDRAALAILPTDHSMFFKCTLNNNGYEVAKKWKWIPNGSAELQTDWGNEGTFSFAVPQSALKEYGPGCVSDGGDYLLTATGDVLGEGTESELIYIDIHTGNEVRRLDLSAWFVDIQDGEAGGHTTSGPTLISLWETSAAIGSFASCLNMLIDVHYENPSESVLWANSNGDYTGDFNWEADAQKPWICNDYSATLKYNFVIEKNGFSFIPSFNMGAVSFGLFAPDGTGLNYHALADETNGQNYKYDTNVISYNSAYDGLLVGDGLSGREGWFWIAQDSYKGLIIAGGPYLAILSPNGGEFLRTDTQHKIIWRAHEVDAIRIEYSVDGGSNWTTLVESIDAVVETYTWIPNGINSSQCLIRITDISNAENIDMSNTSFEITEPFVKVTTPNGSEELEAGTMTHISWSYFRIETVLIEYSTDNGLNWITVADDVKALKRAYRWIVPDIATNECIIRITDASNSSNTDTSNEVFQIIESSLTLLSPNGGEKLQGNRWIPITWTSSDNISSVGIEFSTDNGNTWTLLTSSIPANSGKYTWQIANITSSDCLIKIFISEKPEFYDVNDAVFSIERSHLWTTYTTEDGLHDSIVLEIAIDGHNNKYFSHPRANNRNSQLRARYISKYDNIKWTSFFLDINSGGAGLAVDKNNIVWIAAHKFPFYIVDDEVLQLGLEDTDDKSGGDEWNDYYYVDGIVAISVDKTNKKWFLHKDDQEYVPYICTFDDKVFQKVFNGNSIGTYGLKDIDFDSQNRTWVATSKGLVMHNYDSENWLLVTKEQGVPFERITTITIDKEDVVWIGSSYSQDTNLASFKDSTWTTYSTDNSQLPIDKIHTIEVDMNNVKWIGTDSGVSRFDGETWTTFTTENSGLCDNYVNGIAIEKNNTIWFGTNNGVSKYTGEVIPTFVDEEETKPQALPLIKSYPNPFNPSTTIEFDLPETGMAALTIYNIAGQKVRELLDGYTSAGMHRVVWNGSDDSGHAVSAGVYIARLKAGEVTATGKMVLVR